MSAAYRTRGKPVTAIHPDKQGNLRSKSRDVGPGTYRGGVCMCWSTTRRRLSIAHPVGEQWEQSACFLGAKCVLLFWGWNAASVMLLRLFWLVRFGSHSWRGMLWMQTWAQPFFLPEEGLFQGPDGLVWNGHPEVSWGITHRRLQPFFLLYLLA